MSIPFYVDLANQISSSVFSSIVAAGSGFGLACIGRSIITDGFSCPELYGANFAVANLFWKYVVPYTFDQVFQHPSSNPAAKKMGMILSIAAGYAVSYACEYVLINMKGGDSHERKSKTLDFRTRLSIVGGVALARFCSNFSNKI